MKVLKIITIDKDLKKLRKKSKKLTKEEIHSKKIQTFIDQLIYTAENAKLQAGWESAGLAAIQVDNAVRIFIAKDLIHDVFKVYINPEIEYLGTAKDIKLEGCLSIPETTGMVERHKRIRVRYIDREGNERKEKFDGFNSRIIQHEYDHLEGILFTDKLI